MIIQNYGDGPSCGIPRETDNGLKWFQIETGEWTVCDIPSPPHHGQRILALAEPLLEFIEGRRPALASAEEGRDVLHMTLACYEAAKEGRRVALK